MNDTVRVRLTKAGRTHYLNYHRKSDKEFGITGRSEKIKNDVLEEQLWVIFKIFGPPITLGMDVHFVDNDIEVVVKS
jgi:hypothetical protein